MKPPTAARVLLFVLYAVAASIANATEASDASMERSFDAIAKTHGSPREVADALAAFIEARKADFTIETHANEVEALARREIALRASADGDDSPAYARALGRLGYALIANSETDEAAHAFERAYAIAANPANADAKLRADTSIDSANARRLQRRE